jgi:hypothetical protein
MALLLKSFVFQYSCVVAYSPVQLFNDNFYFLDISDLPNPTGIGSVMPKGAGNFHAHF